LTGEVQVLSADLLYDCGQSLSPEIDIGQVEGSFIIGVGHFLTEGLEYDSTTGALSTFDSWEYKPPQSLDIPIKWATTLLKDVKNPTGFHGSKAVGEPPLLMATSGKMEEEKKNRAHAVLQLQTQI
jgi:xanthine dehydrogenase/oxidase